MELNEIRALAEKIILRPGDLIIDTFTNSKGFLMFRRRHIDMIKDDMYLWQVNWFSHNRKLIYTNIDFYEEESLKISIAMGTVEWHPASGGNNDQMECI
jgi:hypothetical protein